MALLTKDSYSYIYSKLRAGLNRSVYSRTANQHRLFTTKQSSDYELYDCGRGYRYERLGRYKLVRPCLNTLNVSPKLAESTWDDAVFRYNLDTSNGKVKGKWKEVKDKLTVTNVAYPTNWTVTFDHMVFNLGLLDAGQVGVFPEQETNWKFISRSIRKLRSVEAESNTTTSIRNLSILNAFAYTGGSTMACLVDQNVVVSDFITHCFFFPYLYT